MTTIIRRLNATRQPEVSPTAYGEKSQSRLHVYYEYTDGNGKEHGVTVTTVNDRLHELFTIKQRLETVLQARRELLNFSGDLLVDDLNKPTATAKQRLERLLAVNYHVSVYEYETRQVYETMRQIRTIKNQIDVLINEQYETF